MMFNLFKKKNKEKEEVKNNDMVIPSYTKISKVKFKETGKEYWLPIVIWAPDQQAIYSDSFFSQLGKFYEWEEVSVGCMIIAHDGKYIAVRAFDKFYRLPVRVEIKSCDVLADVLSELANFYKWEEVTKKNDT